MFEGGGWSQIMQKTELLVELTEDELTAIKI
jgi:hypothetical protein